MRLYYESDEREPEHDVVYSYPGPDGETYGFEPAIVTKIRDLLKWNVQRRTCPPLFAAIGNAETDAMRKHCLVKAFEAVDIPVFFEYITAKENNLIALIQRLGRSANVMTEVMNCEPRDIFFLRQVLWSPCARVGL